MNAIPELIDISLIVPNRYQPRQQADPDAVAELATSIERDGLLQPPTVRKVKSLGQELIDARNNVPLDERDKHHYITYELAFGHNRWEAFKLLVSQGKTDYQKMPVFVRDLTELQMFELAVAENIQRRDLNPVEQAAAMRCYMVEFRKSSRQAGEFFNVNEATVRGTIRLLDLPEAARQRLASGEITIGAAKKLLVLMRVSPESIAPSVERIVAGDMPDKVIEEALESLVYKNKAKKMWVSWHNGPAMAGAGLWPLDTPTATFAKYLPPVAGLEGVDIRLAKKALEGGELTAQNRPQLEEWARKLQSGLVAAVALIDQGADAGTIERLDQLINPPACTACPFYVRANNNHFCTWKICHTRKKEAWAFRDYQAQQDRNRKLRKASEQFIETEAEPLFLPLLAGLDNLGFLMVLAGIPAEAFENEPDLTRKEKMQRCRLAIIHEVLENEIDYSVEMDGPVATAEQIAGLARTCGVDLPADWLKKAASYWPEGVTVETEKEPA
jgi:ParB/RepB/Spo0J family partition protein